MKTRKFWICDDTEIKFLHGTKLKKDKFCIKIRTLLFIAKFYERGGEIKINCDKARRKTSNMAHKWINIFCFSLHSFTKRLKIINT